MTAGDVTKVSYWIDITVKGAIGVVMTIVGLDYRAVKDSLKELEEHKNSMFTEVVLLKASVEQSKYRLERIEQKIDRIIERVK